MANSDLASRNFRILTLKDEHSRSSTSSTKKSTEELPEFPLDRKKKAAFVRWNIYIYILCGVFWTGGEVDVGVFFGVLVGLSSFLAGCFFSLEAEAVYAASLNKNVCLLEATRTLRVPNWTGIWYGESALGSIWQCLEGPGEQWKKGPSSCLGYIGDQILPNFMGNIILNHYIYGSQTAKKTIQYQVIQPPWPLKIPEFVGGHDLTKLWNRVTWTHSPFPKKVTIKNCQGYVFMLRIILGRRWCPS